MENTAKGKQKYGQWTSEMMAAALRSAVKVANMSVRRPAKDFRIPRGTLQRHLVNSNKLAKDETRHFGRPTILTSEMENDLVTHILLMEKMLFGLSKVTLQELAFQMAANNNTPLFHLFNNEKKMAGRKWFRKFLTRHPQLSLRNPEPTSIARAAGFNKPSVHRFFDILESVIDKYKFDATTIFNMDETSLSTVQKPGKIIAAKGKHQVGSIVSAERGTSVTCASCVSAHGYFLPPFLIFKRKRLRDELQEGTPPGTAFAVQDKGWMDRDLFVQWLDHFIQNVKPSKEAPVLLILDGHISHTGNLNAIEKAEQNGIVMLSLPPHSSHRMQPLDVTYFKPLSSYFNQAADRWIRMHVGRAIQVRHIGGLLAEAFSQASLVATAVKGFEKTGIWPPNSNVFSDDDFFATSVARGDAMPTDEAACTQHASPPPPGAEPQANNQMPCVTPPNLHEATSEPESTQQQEERNNEMAQP